MSQMTDEKKSIVERLFDEQRGALQAFFHRRIRSKADAADLAQDVYLRILRVGDFDAIHNPEGYLFTVASNLVKEHAALDRQRAASVDVDALSACDVPTELPDFGVQLDGEVHVARLRVVLSQLSPRCRAVLLLQYRHGLSYQEIAERLGVSINTVKKYLKKALLHCRKRMG